MEKNYFFTPKNWHHKRGDQRTRVKHKEVYLLKRTFKKKYYTNYYFEFYNSQGLVKISIFLIFIFLQKFFTFFEYLHSEKITGGGV